MEAREEVKSITMSYGEGQYKIHAIMLYCGMDIHVTFAGGELPHIGAVALAIPRKSLDGSDKTSATASVLCVVGHKEDQLARDTAIEFAAIKKSIVTVSVGLHVNNAGIKDIELLLENFNTLKDKIKQVLIDAATPKATT